MTASWWCEIFFVVGLFVGSFLNVVIYRLPRLLMSTWCKDALSFLRAEGYTVHSTPVAAVDGLCWPPSHCVHCAHPIAWYDNIPLISFLWLRGRCRVCHQVISWQYPIVESCSAVCSMLCYVFFGASMTAVWALIFCWSLIVASGIDVRTQCLPDEVTWPLMMLGLVLSVSHVYVSVQEAALGIVLGYYSLWVVHWLFKWLTKKDGFGYGDFKLMAALGSWLGWKGLPLLIFLSAFLGLVVSLLCFLGQKMPGRSMWCTTGTPRSLPFLNIQVPFGPYLAFSGIFFLFLPQTGWYVADGFY